MADMPTHDKSEPQFLASVILYMEQRAKGYAERGDVIFNGRIMAEELGEWIKRLHSAIPSAVAPPEGDDAEAIVKRHAEWDALNKVLGEYVKEYEYGDDGYLPTRQERLLIHDCIQGLLVEDRFMKALARVYPIRSQFNAIASATRLPEEPTEEVIEAMAEGYTAHFENPKMVIGDNMKNVYRALVAHLRRTEGATKSG